MGNPLGSHSGVHKIGCIYYTIPALPPEYLSSLENIFPAFLFHSSDRGAHKFDNKTMFSALINTLIDLEENGDNLGLNSMLGFVHSFSANHYCRICRLQKCDLQTMLKDLLKPKFHILTHYGRLLLQNGPISLTSSLRFEAKHKVLKAYSNSIPCRINLGHTLSHKLQLQMVDRFLTQRGLQPDLKVGSCIKIIEFSQCVLDLLPIEFKLDTVLVSSIEYKGVTFKPAMTPYLVYELYLTVGFDNHFHAYEIKKYDEKELNISGCYIKDLSDITPTVSRVLSNGKLYATLRYAL
ncbi:unnamed protein product [Macrosiphum euphorbiae]|uniref:Uncharacterized protein n=1 Tax=Macrosiphum euphorbiae TaxID=13131 RepID=A0AAV0YAA0_9HEMI|nr:unnamed protein product [Macrosiphum euphorbiae]